MLLSEYENLCEVSESRLSTRGRLTEKVLELTDVEQDPGAGLHGLGSLLDDVLSHDARFPFHLAAYVSEKHEATRLAVALLVECANRVSLLRRKAGRSSTLPFSLRPLVTRVVRTGTDAAYAMAYQVRHFGWGMPSGLRQALSEVLSDRKPKGVQDEAEVPPLRTARRPGLFERARWLRAAAFSRLAVAQ